MRETLEPFAAIFEDESVDEVLVDGRGAMSVVRGRAIASEASPFANREAMADWLFLLSRSEGVRLDPLCPSAGGTLESGAYRWHAVLSPVAIDGPLLALRRHRFGSLTTAAFVGGANAARLAQAFDAGRPLVIAGATGSGKTSLLAALLRERAKDERVVILETIAELPPASARWVRLAERAPSLEGRGHVSLAKLFQECLRLRPDRLIIGEVRGVEAQVFAEAALTGHRGVATTMHAHTYAQVLARLRALTPPALFRELEDDLVVVTMSPKGVGVDAVTAARD